jgi:peptide deformylase
MILKLLECDSPILRQEMELFDFANPPTNPVELYNNLAETMIEYHGLGLSANQVGLPYRAFVLRAEEVIGCFNPKIVDYSSETILMEEGCLSNPGLFVKIKRPKKIKTRYTLPNGETVTKVFDGITARCFQHELDHLNGLLYTSRASEYHLEKAKKFAKKFNRNSPIKPMSQLSDKSREFLSWLK